MESNKNLWTFVNKIWATGQDRKEIIETYHSYWNGDLPAYHIIEGNNQVKTASNIVKPIIEAKVKSVLDIRVVPGVSPNIKTFSTVDEMKEARNIADVYNAEMLRILEENHFEKLQEEICREGMISGAGVIQVLWNTEKNVEGDIKLSVIDPRNLKWDIKATSIQNATFIGYSLTMNSSVAKNTYCKNPDGTFDVAKCKKIDEVAAPLNSREEEETDNSVLNKGRRLVAFETKETTGQAYLNNQDKDYSGINYDQVINLVVMFLLDDSLYAPKESDEPKQKKEKKKGLRNYPNGRMIIFAQHKKHRLVFEDIALDETFKNLGNIDFFYPMSTSNIYGRGEVEDLFTIQDRVNGVYNKYLVTMQNAFSTLIVDRDSGLQMANVVRLPVTFTEGLATSVQPYVVNNNGIEQAASLLVMIDSLKTYAYQQARINETMLFGVRETGITSAAQIKALQESPLTDIRQIQRNFTDFIISVGEKCLNLIQQNYKFNRLIKLTTDIDGSSYAQFRYTENEQGEGQQEIHLFNEAMETTKKIKINKDWKFKVDVIAGTKIPRTREESVTLLQELFDKGILQIENLEMLEFYLTDLDFPGARAIINLLKKQQEKREKNPPTPTMEGLVKNPDLGRAFADIFKSMEGFPLAQGEMLAKLGLNSEPGKLSTTPVAQVASKAELTDVVALVPDVISNDPVQNEEGKEISINKELARVST